MIHDYLKLAFWFVTGVIVGVYFEARLSFKNLVSPVLKYGIYGFLLAISIFVMFEFATFVNNYLWVEKSKSFAKIRLWSFSKLIIELLHFRSFKVYILKNMCKKLMINPFMGLNILGMTGSQTYSVFFRLILLDSKCSKQRKRILLKFLILLIP